MAQYMVKTSLFQNFSSYYIHVYIILITRQIDKQNGLEIMPSLSPGHVLSKIECQPVCAVNILSSLAKVISFGLI